MSLIFRGNIVSTLSVPTVTALREGSASAPPLTFTRKPRSGMYYSTSNASVGFAAGGAEIMSLGASGLAVVGSLTGGSFVGNGAYLTGLPRTTISNVLVTDATWANVLQTSAVSNAGGYCVINGTGFVGDVRVLIGPSIAPTLSTVTPTQIRVTVPPMPNGTYPLWVFANESQAFKMSAISASPLPAWTTAATLANVVKYTAFTQTLAATEASGSLLTYALANGSSLPANVSLTSDGVLAGNITTDPGNTTTYAFSVTASDAQYQQIPRTFSLIALAGP